MKIKIDHRKMATSRVYCTYNKVVEVVFSYFFTSGHFQIKSIETCLILYFSILFFKSHFAVKQVFYDTGEIGVRNYSSHGVSKSTGNPAHIHPSIYPVYYL